METIEVRGSSVVVELSSNELLILNNALNEVCNGIDLEEFSTRMGAKRDAVERLLAEISRLTDRDTHAPVP